MTVFRPFQPGDTLWTLLGAGFGLFYGANFVFIFAFLGLDGVILLLVIGLPFLAVQLVLQIGLDRFSKWRRRNDPPPPPTAWLRHHSISIGATIGAILALAVVLLGSNP